MVSLLTRAGIPGIKLLMQPASVQLYLEIGRRIRDLRIRQKRDGKKITQEFLARALGITRAAISNIETGKQQIYVHTLFRIAEVLGVDISALLPKISDLDMNPLAVDLANREIDPVSKRLIFDLLNKNPKELANRE